MAEGELTGQIVADRYRILDKMGEGGMGTVYLAEHVTIEKKVALKVLLYEYARKEDLKERFLQEAKAAAKIGHENIVDITDFGDTPDGSVFFAMEYLDGIDLSKLIQQQGPIPWGRAKPILLQICRALGAAHSKGIIHRDMKPENIYLIEREGRSDFVKVLDFGIAKMSMENEGQRLTRTGMIFGTPEYMSPEQAQGNRPDHRVDVYAVGVIMYELLTGEVPFKADTFMGILTKHLFEKPVPPSELKPELGIPPEVERLVLKALSKERDDRFRSMAEMAAAITQASGRMSRPTGGDAGLGPRIVTPAGTAAPQGAPVVGPVASSSTTTSVTAPEEEPISIYPRRRPAVLAAIIVGTLLIGGGALAVVLTGGSEEGGQAVASKDVHGTATDAGAAAQVTPDQSAPKVVDHSIKVESEPAGATILRGENPIGKTPATITIPHGERKVLLTLRLEGYKDKPIEVVPLQDQTFSLQLHKRVQGTGDRPKPRVRRVRTVRQVKPRDPDPVVDKPTPPKPRKPRRRPQDDDLMNPFER